MVTHILHYPYWRPCPCTLRINLRLSRLWYTTPPITGGTTHGAFTVHRRAGSPHGVLGFHQSHRGGVSAPHPALGGGVPSPYGGVAPRWEAADRPPICRVQKLPSTDSR